jgi:DNA-binding GntR family transcriptional regulator
MPPEVRKPALGRIKKRSIANEAEERLIQAIASGRLSRGARIVETDIAEDLGVSRIPVREALLHLGSLGILRPAGNRGWQVSSFDDRQIAETYQVRLALETMMLTLAQEKFQADPSKLAPLDTIIGEMRAAAAGDDSREMNRLDLAFHRYAVSVSDNSLAIRMWEGLSQHVLIIFEMEIYRIPDPHAVVAQHSRLRDTLASGKPAELVATLREHITGYRDLMLTRAAGDLKSKG